MPRKSTAWAALIAAALFGLTGCQFFGIDTRPDIRYVTEKQRKDVKEPMYSMAVPGTGLFKQWPMRLGPDYGYAPWEKKPGTVGPDGKVVGGTAIAANGPTGGAPGANVPSGNATAAAKTPAGVELTTPTKSGTKPSLRATPRMADGDLATAQGAAVNSQASAELLAAAEEYGFATGGPETHAAAANQAEVASSQEAPQFRPPMKTSAPAAAAATTAKARGTLRSQLPPTEPNLQWQPPHEEASTAPTAEQFAAAEDPAAGDAPVVDLYASDDAEATDHAADETLSAGSSITLQQPASFAARKAAVKTAAKKPNVVRDKAVRPAGAELPVTVPTAAPRTPQRVTRADIRVPEELGSELVPPTEDPLDDMANKLTDVEAERQGPGSRGQGAGIVAAESFVSGREYAEPVNAAPESEESVYNGSRYLQAHAGEQELATPGYRGSHGAAALPQRSATGPTMPPVARPSAAGAERYSNDAVAAESDEPVFVTASDMGDDDVRVASSTPRTYENPYVRTEQAAGTAPYLPPRNVSESEPTSVMSELEAVKRRYTE
jgi:hypothetical protein